MIDQKRFVILYHNLIETSYLFNYLSTHPSLHPSIHLSICQHYMFICLSVGYSTPWTGNSETPISLRGLDRCKEHC